ncbi:Gfo/Idh/MocA family protein [Pelagibacterium luteolum]|uniref:Oxidoreductase family, C-terminal alpha/beta domain n=1 Tax=Pelagibacterium luteolum TaxID=440168 RepID=A0A1G7V1B7_9HYPH|nr:Gfo/Idh/MocA family oxidoreductase [Pelagibacterium luteolum]SDG53159.1 Oxidoreductase family, C-terminal alpha/beta domain [Pelagibacterium luteolum]
MKYAIVGTGARHSMFRDAITQIHAATAELVALSDINDHRLALSAQEVPDQTGNGIATYRAEQFEQMIAEQKPATVIVTVPDYLHHEYIVAAMRAGCNVVTEKPMTTDLSRLKAILDAQRETGKSVSVTFNYRYTPARTQIKKILQSGAIGDVTAIDFSWHLDRVHGADYFRRWHRYKENSGGLLVHKSTHHFDLVNWWLGSVPESISARGQLAFYKPRMADQLGLSAHGPRCHDCPVAPECDFRMDLETDDKLRKLYLEAEDHDGYLRDKCVFADDITIEDTMQVSVRYRSGAMLNYTLCAYSPWEGLEIRFHGTKGELTHKHVEVHGVFGGKRERPVDDAMTTTVHIAGQQPEPMDVWEGTGDHGGADPIMLGYLLDPNAMEPDLYGRSSTHVDGAWSILTGIAANQSIASGETVHIAQMLEQNNIVLREAEPP